MPPQTNPVSGPVSRNTESFDGSLRDRFGPNAGTKSQRPKNQQRLPGHGPTLFLFCQAANWENSVTRNPGHARKPPFGFENNAHCCPSSKEPRVLFENLFEQIFSRWPGHHSRFLRQKNRPGKARTPEKAAGQHSTSLPISGKFPAIDARPFFQVPGPTPPTINLVPSFRLDVEQPISPQSGPLSGGQAVLAVFPSIKPAPRFFFPMIPLAQPGEQNKSGKTVFFFQPVFLRGIDKTQRERPCGNRSVAIRLDYGPNDQNPVIPRQHQLPAEQMDLWAKLFRQPAIPGQYKKNKRIGSQAKAAGAR